MNDQLQSALQKLAEKLGTSVEHLWGVLIRQARIELLTDVLLFLLGLTVAIGVTRFWYWLNRQEKDLLDFNFAIFMGSIVGTGLAIVLFIAGMIQLFDIPTLLWNPEYWALRQILGAVK